MQIPKIYSLVCVAALGLSTLQAQNADTPEQAKARELLRKKMAELDSKQRASTSRPATTPRQSPAPAHPPRQSPAPARPAPPASNAAFASAPEPAAARNSIPPAVSSAKEQKLSALLTLYRANIVSPEQYQKMRAEILAQP